MTAERRAREAMIRARRTPRSFLLTLTLCVLALLAVAGSARERDEERAALARWERLDEAQKGRLRERFERYQRMSAVERGELAERARNLQRLRERIPQRLSSEERARLLALDHEQRAELVDEIAEDELKAQGHRLQTLLPPEWIERLESADPEERLRFFGEFKERHRARMSVIVLERLGRQLGYAREEVQALQRLPEEQRMEKVLELRKLLQERSVQEHGLPVGLTPQKWEQMLALPAADFFEEVMRIREAGGWTPPAERGERGLVPELLRELRARPAERLELAHLPAQERRAELSRRRRARIEEFLREREALPAHQLEELECASEAEFYLRLRRMLRPAREAESGSGG